MQIDKIILLGGDLALIDNSFAAIRPPYSKRVTVNYTFGKNADDRWGNEPASVWGVTFPKDVQVNETKAECSGSCLVDLTAILAQSVTPAWSIRGKKHPAKLSPDGFRRNVVGTVVHELMHVMQGWQIGQRFRRAVLEETLNAKNRASDYSQKNQDMPESAYFQDMFESGARDFTSRWMDAHGEEIRGGAFNFLLPMSVMRGLFPDVPGAYP